MRSAGTRRKKSEGEPGRSKLPLTMLVARMSTESDLLSRRVRFRMWVLAKRQLGLGDETAAEKLGEKQGRASESERGKRRKTNRADEKVGSYKMGADQNKTWQFFEHDLAGQA
ncbi:hypothetical protein ANO11243_007810 [Dothideomycetidae sp. 11243]|nr:hypothetical protein ANO11243_007810 [fungal sp. No.11243]